MDWYYYVAIAFAIGIVGFIKLRIFNNMKKKGSHPDKNAHRNIDDED
ncbi:MAG: hypothetical protein PHY42_03100 [Bacilli bacterium]|nr:hypothetical protein [Bacilli bacterium]